MSDEALTYVELDIDYCSLTYGTAPCTASVPTTGAQKCFNSLVTCQDTVHFTNSPVTLRFSVDTGHNPDDIEALPFIARHEDVSITPGRISLGEDLGQRESVSVTFGDRPHPDTGPGFDKYLANRTYDPYAQGTFWGKFRARQPYLKGRNLRLYRGFVGQALADMECRHYIIDSYTGPGVEGRYTIVAKDILKLLDGDQAQAPGLSSGSLAADITSSATTATLVTGTGNGSNYGSAGKLAIGGKEIVSYYRDPTAGNDADTKLLLHFDGNLTDSSASARTATAVNGATTATTDPKFGSASLSLNGTNQYITFPDSADWTFAADFEIDCNIKSNSLAALQTVWSHSTDANNQYRLKIATTGALTFEILSSGSAILTMSSAAGVVTAGTKYHVAVVRSGNNWTIYVDGVVVATTTGAVSIPNFTSTFRIGTGGGATSFFAGLLDEFRVSAVARWTAAFDAPEAPYNTSSDILTLLARGLNGTDAAAHEAGDRVQVCVEYSAQRPDQIVADLMENYGGVDAAYLPTATWQTETETFNRRLYTGIIAEPTPVRTLIQEMIQQAGLAIWWDPTEQLVFLQALRAVTSDAMVYDETNILAQGSLQVSEQPDKRVSQVWVYYGQRNPLDGQDDPANYRSTEIILDATAEANYGAAAIRKIFSRWIAFGGQTTAERIGNLQLGRYVNPPRKFAFSLLRGEGIAGLLLGAGYYIGNPELQDADGSRLNVPVQITRDRSDAGLHAYEAEENAFVSYDTADSLTVVIDSDVRNINLRTLYDTLYSSPLSGDTITFIVNEHVIVGSTSASLPAVDVGSWPSVSTTGNRTSDSATLTGIADTSAIDVGMIVKGTGIPAGAKVISKTSSSITLDANATSGSSTSTSLTVFVVRIELKIKDGAYVSGAGGPGGQGAQGNGDQPGARGSDGGTALKTTCGITVTIESGGTLQGGGGGGGGAGTRVYDDHNGGGGGGGAGDAPGAGGPKGGNFAQGGNPGTLTAGGSGGLSWTTNGGLFEQPHLMAPSGATAGAPGQNGAHAPNVDIAGGDGGAGGKSIDGASYAKVANSGTISGSQVN